MAKKPVEQPIKPLPEPLKPAENPIVKAARLTKETLSWQKGQLALANERTEQSAKTTI